MDINYLVNILLFVFVGWFVYKRVAPVKSLRNLTDEQLRGKLKAPENSTLIDVRETHEYSSGHIHGAINIPLSKLKQSLTEIPTDKELILYCQSGIRSKQAAKILQKQKYKDISHLSGGIASWSGKKIRGNG
ncbi:rhodanese-like domain-containing protein [Aquibacillus sp. 3ASR75-11]|uniref:Rhodanese-like domain-containing protein n=1 Tax=Terrihalobacillus insolitus TaxID=2950438 RepID=A0A9X3WT26_9BACI|nr:rhodanese-like domain-containing protein [Terrihalobacillus insolitus]MDC3424333.1 rhodanese-like domain-containing protein [Terrihalobacillus insolitus]